MVYALSQLGLNVVMVLVSAMLSGLRAGARAGARPPGCLRRCAGACGCDGAVSACCRRDKGYEDPPYATFLQERPSIYQQQVRTLGCTLFQGTRGSFKNSCTCVIGDFGLCQR